MNESNFRIWRAPLVLGTCGLLLVGCGGDDDLPPEPGAEAPAGALVQTRLTSTVGVLLDELPDDLRERAASELIAEDEEFWLARARAQVALTAYRLVFRNFFYDEADGKGQLPLPPAEVLEFELAGKPKRVDYQGHDLVTVEYTLESTLLSDPESVADTEEALAEVGGTWEEPFVLPIDPELLFQRTGYACMDEAEFPPNSVDGENVATFYDHECEGGDELCHLSEMPDEDCVEAIERAVGSIEAPIVFERLPWDAALAERARVGEVTYTDQPDVAVITEGLDVQRVIYRYIDDDSCALAENCVTGKGWRRLLQFDASVKNLGGEALDIGDIDYYLEGSGSVLADHNIFEYSECHEHYHFSYYGDFQFGSGDAQTGNKQAFCLQSTNRYSNNEYSPLTHPYGACNFQGIQAGWGDDYGAGIECQWVDVTDVELSGDSAEGELSFIFNPEAFLCEGTPVLDEDGNPVFEATEFETVHGDPVDRLMCDFVEGWDQNNRGDNSVQITRGGLITSACTRGQIGPLRDCGFAEGAGSLDNVACAPGKTISVRCTLPDDAAPAVVRACEYSKALETGTACVYRDALVNSVVEPGSPELSIECPAARDEATEPGGTITLYSAPLLPTDAAGALDCELVP